MTAARAARRGLVGTLLLHRIDVTDANPWLGLVGLLVTIVAAGVLDGWLP